MGTLKVIIETAAIGPDRIAPASHAAEAGGADFVKPSTGFHPVGATRIGTSHTAAILNGVHDE